MTQDQAFSLLKTGVNVFLTGEPGSGKTHTVNRYVSYLREHSVEPAITASTGIAATHIGGMTIHSWSGIGIKTSLDKHDLADIAASEYIVKRVSRAKVLMIDEVSMLPPNTLAMVDAVCRKIKDSSESFGGMQVVLVGDFFQLPPIVKIVSETGGQGSLIAESRGRFAYESPAWESARFTTCYLTEQHRQDDRDFLGLLSAIRSNTFRESHAVHIRSRKIERHKAPTNAPKLFSKNIDVDHINNETLASIPGKLRMFPMSHGGSGPLLASLRKSCLSPEHLELKIGATVMFTKNNQQEHFVNGMLGTVVGFESMSGYPVVNTRAGQRITVKPMDWSVEENGVVRARIAQIPLRLAWAITVHKSQGMSLDEAVMDLSDVFEFGQGYVALSRVRRLSGLHLLGWNERAFKVHPEVLVKDESFRTASRTTEGIFAENSSADIAKQQEDFLIRCGGKKTKINLEEKKVTSGNKLDLIREKHPNAYRPWGESQDEQLRELFGDDTKVLKIAKTLGRKPGAIRSRLIKLGLLEYEA